MDPQQLIAPTNPVGLPVPFWFIEIFKVLGFTLHAIPMNIWYAGALIAAGFGVFGRGDARLVGRHVARALPFMIAFGINFGIIPLLFIQTSYYQFFYPATVLMAWPWFSVIWLVMAAYFATYMYRLAIRGGAAAETASVGETEHARRASSLLQFGGTAGILFAAAAFIVVGFIFNNAFSMMTNVGNWSGIFFSESVSSAVTGLGLNLNDPTLVPRWLFVFALAITTTAVFIAVDAAYLSGREPDNYRRYASRFAFIMYSIGLLMFIGLGSWYIFGTLGWAVKEMIHQPVMRIVFPLAAVSPGLPWLLLLLGRNRSDRRMAGLAAFAQFGVVGLNAITRQWVQNRELAPYINLANQPVDLQTGAMVLFLSLLAGAAVLIAWMVRKVVAVNRDEWRRE